MAKRIDQRELESLIRQELTKTSPAKATKEETDKAVQFLKTQYMPTKRETRCSFLHLVLAQVRLGAGKIWIFQGGVLLLFWALIKAIYRDQMKTLLIRHLPFSLASFGMLLVMLSIPWIYRSIHYKMLEIECAARFSLGNLILARLLILGIGDVAILAAVLGGFTIDGTIIMKHILLWGMISFLTGAVVLTSLIAKGLLNHLYLFYGGFFLAFCVVFWAIDTIAPQMTEQAFSSGYSSGGILCAVLIVLLYMELKKIRKGVEIWNFKLISL